MYSVPKWLDTIAARFLKCIGPFWNIMHYRVKFILHSKMINKDS